MRDYISSLALWLICFRIAILIYCTTTQTHYDIMHGKVMGEFVRPPPHVPYGYALNRPAPLALHTTHEKYIL